MSDKVVYLEKKGTKRSTYYQSGRRSISKRRPLNRFEAEAGSESVSTSAKKLKLSEGIDDIEVNESFGYRILNFMAVFSTISELVVCKTCGSDVTFSESAKRGLGFKIIISCANCEKTSIPNSPFIDKGYEINRRIILAMRLLGIGLNGIAKFCAFMDLPQPIFHSFYDSIIRTISIATKSVHAGSMKKAAEDEKKMCAEKGQTDGITVSGDGSWRKRGFSSLFELVSLIGWCTGKVIDVVVKSKYCKSCEFWKTKEDTAEYYEWKQGHDDNCQANHEGSAGKMEADGIVEMFQRSEDLHNVKYTNYIGDGDSKTFKGILDSEPYDDITVKKRECIDHVQKRMGTRLRNLKKTTKGLGGKGKLTGKIIDELTIYYGLAIRRNHTSIDKMRNDIWATLYHKISTNDKPQHDKCPTGPESWCTWQKAKALNDLDSYQHKPALPNEVFQALKPVYEELSSDDLLGRCLGGYTQNSNESFNATVWSLAPKSHSNGKTILDISTDLAVCIFNDGITSVMKVMQVLGMTIGSNCYNFCVQADAKRIAASEESLTEAARLARLSLKSARKEEEEDNFNLEGQLYMVLE